MQDQNPSGLRFDERDFMEALNVNSWRVTHRLHTPGFEAILHDGLLTLVFPDGQRKQFARSDVEALTRFLDQYAEVAPLPPPDMSVFENWQPVRVDLGQEEL